ncbi:hypothetical protein CDO52_09220 [Nocardiopsis gilva YIM 90087]|uniref:Uncharacterized protein n=2 Tax=Nocardiopsis gilva TaxID=280236 RepID=A0A223S4D8_9ACTN|nr:hypothetical protein CDO52_09220 [Nocardiopsis gilva YIM 90087]
MARDVGQVTFVNGSDRGRQRVPQQVPAAPACFVNRDADLAGIGSALGHRDGAQVVVFQGAHGIGKSSLLRRGAAALRDRFPGGQFYFEFPQVNAEKRADADVAVTTFLRHLGVGGKYLPDSYEGRVAEFRTLTRDSATLVVLEGAREPAQVRALIPSGAGSAVLVASDGPSLAELELDGARSMTLRPLDAEDGRKLLIKLADGRIAEEEREAADRLVAACHGLPLAIVMVAARLRGQPTLKARALAKELEDEKRRLTAMGVNDHLTLSATFGLTYRRLSAPASTLYRALGSWPGPHVDSGLAACVAEIDENEVRPLLRELVDANLIEECRADRYRFRHALIHLDARNRADRDDPDRERLARLRRGLDRFLALMAFADLAVMGTRTRVTDIAPLMADASDPFDGDKAWALEWLDGERETIVELVSAAARSGLSDHAWQLAEMATALYMNIRYIGDWVRTGTIGADAAQKAGNARAEARLRSVVSRPLTDLGKLDQAGEQLDRALEVVAHVDDLMLRSSVQEFHGRYLDQVDPDRAIAAYDRCQDLSERFAQSAATEEERRNGRRGAALAVYFRGCSHAAAERDEIALTELSNALDRFRALRDERMAARARVSLGRVHQQAGRLREASRELNDAVRALRDGGHSYYEAEAQETLADIHVELGAEKEARRHLTRAVEIYEAGGSPRARTVRARLADLGEDGD